MQQFKKIVDELLCELMAELEITQEMFLEACDKAQSDPRHQKIVQQILAVEDFLTFKKLMAKRNAELNAEALKMMLQKEKDALMKKAEEERIKKEAEEKKKKEIEDQQKLLKTSATEVAKQKVVDPEFLRLE